MQLFFTRYQPKLLSMLNSINPEGYIAKKRFTEVIRSLGAENSDDVMEVLLGSMALEADNTSNLDYRALIDKFGQ